MWCEIILYIQLRAMRLAVRQNVLKSDKSDLGQRDTILFLQNKVNLSSQMIFGASGWFASNMMSVKLLSCWEMHYNIWRDQSSIVPVMYYFTQVEPQRHKGFCSQRLKLNTQVFSLNVYWASKPTNQSMHQSMNQSQFVCTDLNQIQKLFVHQKTTNRPPRNKKVVIQDRLTQ